MSRTDRSRLDPNDRPRTLTLLRARDYDLVIVGGGVTGCGVALDAAARGLSVALVESGDLAQSDTDTPPELVIAGPPWSEGIDLAATRRLASERTLFAERLCPYLVRRETFVAPWSSRAEEAYVRSTAVLARAASVRTRRQRAASPVSQGRSVPRQSWGVRGTLSRDHARGLLPALRPEQVRGAVRYVDGVLDSARHTLAIARTAARLGATVATRLRALDLVRVAGKARGVRVRDEEGGEEFDITARVVVNATGVDADRLPALGDGRARFSVGTARDLHLGVPLDRFEAYDGIALHGPGRALVVRRGHAHWWISELPTGDIRTRLEPDRPPTLTAATAPIPAGGTSNAGGSADVARVLALLGPWLRSPLTPADVVRVFRSPRPVVAVDGEPDLDPGDVTVEDRTGLVTVVGGSHATYRLRAREAVDAVAERLRQDVRPSRTRRVSLVGSLPRTYDQPGSREVRRRLAARYGSLVPDLEALVDERPELGRPVPGAEDHTGAEIVYAVTAEGAMHLTDVMLRRTRIGVVAADRGREAAPTVAALMGRALGWSETAQVAEVEAYAELLDALETPRRPADPSAPGAPGDSGDPGDTGNPGDTGDPDRPPG